MLEHVTARGTIRLLAALLLVTSLGCGGGPGLVGVSGVVTRGGQPVENVQVTFMPETGRPAWGATDAEGRYTLEFAQGDLGIVPGKYKVVVKYIYPDMETEIAMTQGKKPLPPGIKEILAKYGDEQKTPLEFDIQGPQEIDLALD